MAESNKLRLVFKDESGSNITMTYSYADPEVTDTNIGSLMTTIVTNGSIYQKVPVTPVSATLVQTTEKSFTLQ